MKLIDNWYIKAGIIGFFVILIGVIVFLLIYYNSNRFSVTEGVSNLDYSSKEAARLAAEQALGTCNTALGAERLARMALESTTPEAEREAKLNLTNSLRDCNASLVEKETDRLSQKNGFDRCLETSDAQQSEMEALQQTYNLSMKSSDLKDEAYKELRKSYDSCIADSNSKTTIITAIHDRLETIPLTSGDIDFITKSLDATVPGSCTYSLNVLMNIGSNAEIINNSDVINKMYFKLINDVSRLNKLYGIIMYYNYIYNGRIYGQSENIKNLLDLARKEIDGIGHRVITINRYNNIFTQNI